MKIKLLLVLSYILSFFLYRQYKQGAVLLITSVTEYLGKNTCPLGPLFKLKNFHGIPDALIRKEDNHQYKLYHYYDHGYYSEVIFVGNSSRVQQFLMKYVWIIHRLIVMYKSDEALRPLLKSRMFMK